ncbi:palmitoyltransferase [Chamberlinius hualienensis]
MVKLVALGILYKNPSKVVTLKTALDLSSFGYFQRTSIQQFMVFTSELIVERTHPGSRSSFEEKDYNCHVYVRADNLAGVAISDQEYPNRVAHTLITKILDDFTAKVPQSQWGNVASEGSMPFKELDDYLVKYQNPRQADAMTKIQADLDETKIILHKTIEAVLERGEKLDDLVAKSDQLSIQSKAFYTTAKKTNSCCKIL